MVIPTYNRANFIADTINSVLAQDFTDFEVVVIDDGSTDTTAEIIEQNFSRDERIRYFRQQNAERGAARNHGFKESRGRYVVFFDSDDVMHSDHLRALYALIEKYPQANFLATKYRLVRNGKPYFSDVNELPEGWHGIDLVLHGNPLACNFCVKKENTRLKLFLEDRRYAVVEDWMFLVENLIDDKIYIGDEVTISMIDHAQRSMRGDNSEIVRKRLLAKDWIDENIGLSSEQRRLLDGYSYYFCAIHSYLDGNRKNSLMYLWYATRKLGANAKINALFVKTLIGFRHVQKLKKSESSEI